MTPRRVWAPGDLLTHRFNPELGIGRVTALDGRAVMVEFPRSGDHAPAGGRHRGAAASGPEPRPARPRQATHEETTVAARLGDGTMRLANGETVPAHALWPIELEGALLDRLALGDVDELDDFLTRLDILHLLALREADGLGSFLGGRVRLFPHQLHVAERASGTRSGPLAAGRRSRPRQDRRGVADPESPGAHGAGRALPGGGARLADRAVAGRAVAQIPPGVHAARRAAPGRRGARLRRRLQPVRRPPARGDRAGDADRAAAS